MLSHKEISMQPRAECTERWSPHMHVPGRTKFLCGMEVWRIGKGIRKGYDGARSRVKKRGYDAMEGIVN